MEHPDKITLKRVKAPNFTSVRATSATFTLRATESADKSLMTLSFYNDVANIIKETLVKVNNSKDLGQYQSTFDDDDTEIIREEVSRVTIDAIEAFALAQGILDQLERSGMIQKAPIDNKE